MSYIVNYTSCTTKFESKIQLECSPLVVSLERKKINGLGRKLLKAGTGDQRVESEWEPFKKFSLREQGL